MLRQRSTEKNRSTKNNRSGPIKRVLGLLRSSISSIGGKKFTSEESHKIAVIAAERLPIIQELIDHFISELRARSVLNFHFTLFNAHGDSSNTRKHMDEIIDGGYHLIFSLGGQSSAIAKEVTHHRRKNIPIVFACALKPVQNNLVESEECSQNNVTGVKCEDKPRYIDQVNLLLSIKPTIKHILAYYNPLVSYEHKDALDLQKEFKKKKITFTLIEVVSKSEVVEKTEKHFAKVDTILTLRNNQALYSIEELVKLCNRRGITLFSSDLKSVDKGAAVGFGVSSNFVVQNCAEMVVQILEHGKAPSAIPVLSPQFQYKIRINQKTMKQQGLALDPRIMFLIEHAEVF